MSTPLKSVWWWNRCLRKERGCFPWCSKLHARSRAVSRRDRQGGLPGSWKKWRSWLAFVAWWFYKQLTQWVSFHRSPLHRINSWPSKTIQYPKFELWSCVPNNSRFRFEQWFAKCCSPAFFHRWGSNACWPFARLVPCRFLQSSWLKQYFLLKRLLWCNRCSFFSRSQTSSYNKTTGNVS